MNQQEHFLRKALQLARRGCGQTSPNPMVGAVLVKGGKVIGRGWHRQAGFPHAEVEALNDARKRGYDARGATIFVTLEPCSTHGRTPPCTEALISAGVKTVIAGATDPNPAHAGRAFRLLTRAGIAVTTGVLATECTRLNEAFNHWIVHRTPFVTVKAAMTLDGKIATASGESKWITGEAGRAYGMKLREGADGILAGINTILADNPGLTWRPGSKTNGSPGGKLLRRFVLDATARTPLDAKVVSDEHRALTTIIVSKDASASRLRLLSSRVSLLIAPAKNGMIDLKWVLRELGERSVTSLLVEGGGEVNASFLMQRLAQRIAFFYAPKVLGGRHSRYAVGGAGAANLAEGLELEEVEWKRLGPDLLLSARMRS